MPIEPGQSLLHYRIVEKIGEGGMGVVYRATDTKLGRDVALKLLSAKMASKEEWLERFRREARAVAALTHPHIVTIHSVEETENATTGEPVRFLTMELIDGTSLDRLIPAEGLPTDQLYALGIQLADALSEAHEKGIVHRDLKPANVMVNSTGQLKILDFGLAKLDEATADPEAKTEMVTRDGIVMGTVPYMSPEQVSSRPVDLRTDLFSLGTILYEMASGAQPFMGDSLVELASAILRDPAPPLSAVRSDLPPQLVAIIHRCLEKEPADRVPSARQLHDELQALQSGPALLLAAAVASPRRPFVGREAESEEIRKMLEAARAGRGGLVMLGGEPGVGKTRLAEELLADGADRGMLALKGHAYEEEGAPFVTALEILEEMARLLPPDRLRGLLGDNASEIARLMPELRRRFSDIPEPVDLPPEQQRRYLFNSVLEFLERASRATPMMILLDDLHWADESSLLLLEHIAPHLDRLPLLFVGTYRDVELEVGRPFAKMRADLVRKDQARRIAIRRFGEEDVSELLVALGGAGPPASLVQAIFKETEGNPFFVTEVFEHLAEEGSLFNEKGGWRANLDVAGLEVPEGVRLVIGRRLERLDPATPKVLTVAAIIGLRFDLGVVEGAVRTDPDDVLEAIEEAEAARMVAPLPGHREPRYEFVHTLVRQTLLNTLSVPRKQRHHLRIAESMEKAWGSRAEERAGDIAHHLYQSGAAADSERTRRYLAIAAQRALEAAAADEALVLVDRAFEFDDEIEGEEKGRLHHLRGQADRTLGRWADAAIDWEAALPLLVAVGDNKTVAAICESLINQRLWANEIDEAKGFAERGLQAVGKEPSAARCRLLAGQGHAYGNGGDYECAEELNGQAIAMAEELADDRLLGVVLIGRLYQCEHWLEPRRQAETGNRAIALARKSGTAWDLCAVMGASCFGIINHGGPDRIEALLKELFPLSLKLGHNGGEVHCLYGAVLIKLWRGDLLGAREALQVAIDRSLEMGMPWVSLLYAWAGTVEFMLGEEQKAKQAFDEALARELPLSFSGCEKAHLMRVLAHAGDARAATMMRELRPRLPKAGVKNPIGAWHAGMATLETAVLTGKPEMAAHLYPCATQLIDEAGAVCVWAMGLTERFAGIAAAAGGQWELAEEHFDNALRQAQEIPHRLERPEVLRWHGWMLLQRGGEGDRERAELLLKDARERYEEMGMGETWETFP